MTKQQSAKALAEQKLKDELEEKKSIPSTTTQLDAENNEKIDVILLCNYGEAMANTELALPISRAKKLIANGLAKEAK